MVNGKWKVTAKTPMGTMQFVFNMVVEGENLTGSVVFQGKTSEIINGKVNGDEFSFSTKLQTPMGVKGADIVGSAQGDNLSGKATVKMLGTHAYTGSRM